MQLSRDPSTAKYQITRCEDGTVTVNDTEFTESILVMPHAMQDWKVRDIKHLQEDDLSAMLELKPDVILLGTGRNLIFPPDELLEFVKQRGVGVEIMNTAAACRTYTVLISEGRKVLAALVV